MLQTEAYGRGEEQALAGSPVGQAGMALSQAVVGLRDAVEELCKRVEPVLRPREDRPPRVMPQEVPAPSSAFVATLEDWRREVEHVRADVVDVLERLEL